jgi:8-oxo-dGTP pyrophosphatase MutT (NUDIX family)
MWRLPRHMNPIWLGGHSSTLYLKAALLWCAQYQAFRRSVFVQHHSVPDLLSASIGTVGAYVLLEDAYLFAIGPNRAGPTLAVFRLGGHRSADEPAWACAAREVYEEAAVHIQPLSPPATYWIDVEHGDTDVQAIPWPVLDSSPAAPLLVVSAQRSIGMHLSVMYLARTFERPTPSTEIRGLLFLRPDDVHRIVHQSLTLGAYLRAGGDAMLLDALEEGRIFEPFLQLQALSWILQIHQNVLCAPA